MSGSSDMAALPEAAIAMLMSCEDGIAIVRNDAARQQRFDPWPEMDALAVALDAAVPGWLADALAHFAADEDQHHG